jgi:uncharacterized protein (TIGR03437 family)
MPLRLQQTVGSGQFPGPVVITGAHVRSGVGTGRVTLNLSSFKVTLSTTQVYPNTNGGHVLPGTTYANNVGPDAATVYNSSFTASSPGCTGPAACPFDILVPFTAPFSYDPTKGRLLVDMIVSADPSQTGSLDGVAFTDPTTSTVALVLGDSAQAAGMLALGGFVFGLDIVTNPTISSVQNAASNILGALPNGGIAQGSIFIVKGNGLGPATLLTASTPFQSTTLSGASVTVTVGGTKVNALMYYTSAGQVAALMPSNTPTGAGTLTVTYNNLTSAPVPINVVASNAGIFTVDSTGQGPGIVTFADYSLVSSVKTSTCGGVYTACGAANPGDTLILWATGLGPVSGSDAAGAGLGQNMPNLPLKLWLGGIQAPVVYQGRSGCCVGEDQIVFTVPNNTPTGCAVPLVVQIGNLVSNNTEMAVANGSRDCTPSAAPLAPLVSKILAGQPITFADVDLSRDFNNAGTAIQDDAQFQFLKVLTVNPGTQAFAATFIDDLPAGNCLVYNRLDTKKNNPIASTAPVDAGSTFTIKGPNGTMTVTVTGSGKFTTTLSATGMFLVPGTYTITGPGGADIGNVNGTTTMPPAVNLVSPALTPGNTVTRANGLTLTWTGGVSNAFVEIQAYGATDKTVTNGATVDCKVPGNAGTFTIPAWAMLALPPGNFGGIFIGQEVTNTPLTGLGLDAGVFNAFGTPTSVFGFTLK